MYHISYYFSGANELRLKAIVTSGGPQKLCQLWHTDVYEVRQIIMHTFRRLLQTDLVFCAKSDVEFFVWKICFYNLVATLRHWLQGGTIPQVRNNFWETTLGNYNGTLVWETSLGNWFGILVWKISLG